MCFTFSSPYNHSCHVILSYKKPHSKNQFISTMDVSKTLLAFLSAEIIEQCIVKLKLDCPGCQEGLLSHILHRHTHFSLLETIRLKLPEISTEVDIKKLYNNFLIRFGLFDQPDSELVNIGQCFIRFSTAEALYYGNYITKDNEKHFYEAEYEPTPVKDTKKRKLTEI